MVGGKKTNKYSFGQNLYGNYDKISQNRTFYIYIYISLWHDNVLQKHCSGHHSALFNSVTEGEIVIKFHINSDPELVTLSLGVHRETVVIV